MVYPQTSGLDISFSDMSKATLRIASCCVNLRGATLKDMSLVLTATSGEGDFSNLEFSGSSIHFNSGARGYSANFSGTKFHNVKFIGDISDVSFNGATFSKVWFVPQPRKKKIKFENVNLENVDLGSTNMSKLVYDKNTVWPNGYKPKEHGAERMTAETQEK